jgi:hypothetical protein
MRKSLFWITLFLYMLLSNTVYGQPYMTRWIRKSDNAQKKQPTTQKVQAATMPAKPAMTLKSAPPQVVVKPPVAVVKPPPQVVVKPPVAVVKPPPQVVVKPPVAVVKPPVAVVKPPSVAVELSDITGFKWVSLLKDRLRCQVPESAFEKAREEVKGAPPPPGSERESRIILYSRGKEGEMILMASDTLSIETDEFEQKTLDFWQKREGTKFRLVLQPTDGSYRLLLLVSESIPKGASFVRGAYIIQADKTIQFAAIYGSPDTMERSDQAIILAEKILRTLRPGERKVLMSEGNRYLDTFDPNKKIEASVPNGYITNTNVGPDFLIHFIQPIAKFGELVPQLAIFIGKEPNLFFKQAPQDEIAMENPNVRMFGRAMNWYKWHHVPKTKDQTIYYIKELLITLPELSGANKLHVTFSFEQKDQNMEPILTRIAESLRIIQP